MTFWRTSQGLSQSLSRLSKDLFKAFARSRPFLGLLKVFEVIFKAVQKYVSSLRLFKAFSRISQGLLESFSSPLNGLFKAWALSRPFRRILKVFWCPIHWFLTAFLRPLPIQGLLNGFSRSVELPFNILFCHFKAFSMLFYPPFQGLCLFNVFLRTSQGLLKSFSRLSK